MNNISRMRSVALAFLAGMAIIAAPGAAQAQFWGFGSWYGRSAPWVPAPAYPGALDEERLGPGEVVDVLRSYGWTILGQPALRGGRYVATVRNVFGQRLYVVLDAYSGTVLRSRPFEDQPDTSRLAAIPNAAAPAAPDDRYTGTSPRRPVTIGPGKPRKSQAKRVGPPPPAKARPVEGGDVAVAKPTSPPPAAKSPAPSPAPAVREIYPRSGDAPSAPTAAPEPAPQTAASAPAPAPALAPVSPAPAPTPAPAKAAPPPKSALPADAGFE
jgi:hypothetical protein